MYVPSSIVSATADLVGGSPFLTTESAGPFDLFLPAGDDDSQLQRWSSFIGIVTAIIGNILISFALNIQRYAHIRLHEEAVRHRRAKKLMQKHHGSYGTNNGIGNDDVEAEHVDDPLSQSFRSVDSQNTGFSEVDEERSSYLKSPYWWTGIVLMCVGEAGNFLAYGFAPASIVSPLGVVALISNCVIAPIMLKEHFRMRDFWGVLVAIGGAVTVVLSANQEEKKLGPHEVWSAITQPEFLGYVAVTISMIVALMWASPKYGNRTVVIDLGLVGLFGGYTALSTKGVASVLSATLWRALTTPVTYALVAVLVGTALMQIKYVNRALQRFDSTQVIPVQFVLFTISVIVGSAVLYRDFESTTTAQAAKFCGGCLLTFFGVFLITSGRERHEDDDFDDDLLDDSIGAFNHESNRLARLDEASASTTRPHSSAFASDDVAGNTSRHGSRVSFASTLDRPQTLGRYLSDTAQSVAIVLSPAEELPEEDVSLVTNPWNDPESGTPEQRLASLSTSALPTDGQYDTADFAETPVVRSTSHTNLRTPPNHQSNGPPTPTTRPATPVRGSLSRMRPSPLISTLTSPLSAVVADTLRRGVETPPRSKSRHGSRSSRSRSVSHRLSHGEDEALLGTSIPEQEENSDTFQRTRTRSLSHTLGDIFNSLTRTQRESAQDALAEDQSNERTGSSLPG